METNWDVIVVGGGPAGCSAALLLGRSRRRVVVLDSGLPRNRFAEHTHGVLGHEGLAPAELRERSHAELAAYGVEVVDRTVDSVHEDGDGPGLLVRLTDATTLRTRALVLASGLTDVLPDIPGLAEHWGTSVLHCPYCHGWEVRGKRLGVLTTSPPGMHHAQLIRQWTDDEVVFTAGMGGVTPEQAERLRARDVDVVTSAVSEVLSTDGVLTGVRTEDGAVTELDAIFVGAAARPHDEFVTALDLQRADTPLGSFIAVDAMGRTSHDRVWAVGNVTNPGANVALSIGAGAFAAGAVNMALVEEDFEVAQSPLGHWESRYAEKPRMWSGRVNATMAEVVSALPVGDVLDLGCGEGGDAVWLAEQGWRVSAVDISPTAIARGAEGARSRGVTDRIDWVARDLSTWRPDGDVDLVTASFFHSTVELDRTAILRRAAHSLRPGGHLLIVSHVFETEDDIPPWARRHHAEEATEHGAADQAAKSARHEAMSLLLTPEQEVAALDLDEDAWEVVRAEILGREATGPDGQETHLFKDGVVLLRRRTAPDS